MTSISLKKSGVILSLSKVTRILVSLYTFAIVPRFLDTSSYGLIAVIGSATVLLSTLDFGFGQGLRNKCNSEPDNTKQAKYFYSVIISLVIITILISLLCYMVLNYFDISKKLFSIPIERKDLIKATNFSLIILLLNIPFSIASLLMMSFHEYFVIFFYDICNILFSVILASLLLIYKDKFTGDLFLEATVMGVFIINIIFTLIFLKRRKWLSIVYIPSFKKSILYLKDVFKVGKNFLVGSISYTIFFYADTIIIANLLNLEKAGDFRIMLALYQSGIAVLQTYFSPLWDISGKMISQKKFSEIIIVLRKNSIFVLIVFMLAVVFAPLYFVKFIELWTGRTLEINFYEIEILQVWFFFNIFPYSYNMVLNGMSKLKPIVVLQIIGAILKIPICIFLGQNYGLSGIVLANTIILFPTVIIYPLYTYKYLKQMR